MQVGICRSGTCICRVVWNSQLGLIGSNRRCSSVMETQLTVHHRSINNWNLRKVCERDGYEVHDLITDHGRFICGTYKVLPLK